MMNFDELKSKLKRSKAAIFVQLQTFYNVNIIINATFNMQVEIVLDHKNA